MWLKVTLAPVNRTILNIVMVRVTHFSVVQLVSLIAYIIVYRVCRYYPPDDLSVILKTTAQRGRTVRNMMAARMHASVHVTFANANFPGYMP